MPVVVDASVALTWLFDDEATQETLQFLVDSVETGIVVPGHWFVELANAVRTGLKLGRINDEERARFTTVLQKLTTDVDPLGGLELIDRITLIALTEELTVYDALYFELAQRRRFPLATLDRALIEAARKNSMPLIDFTP